MLSSLGPPLRLFSPLLSDSTLSCHLLPHPPFFISHPGPLHGSTLLAPFLFLRIMHFSSPFVQFSFSNSAFFLLSLFPFLFSVCLFDSSSTRLSLFCPLSLCPQEARRMIMRSRSQIHQCVSGLFPKSPLRACPPLPSSPFGSPPAH